jgi:hypothetical protein
MDQSQVWPAKRLPRVNFRSLYQSAVSLGVTQSPSRLHGK